MAYDPDRAKRILDELGLRKKLIQLHPGNVGKPQTTAWWLSKEPLPLEVHGGGSRLVPGWPAKGRKIRNVAHETGPAAHRMITWRYDRRVRAFISRDGIAGEMAAH